jgi:hypothetical protein
MRFQRVQLAAVAAICLCVTAACSTDQAARTKTTTTSTVAKSTTSAPPSETTTTTSPYEYWIATARPEVKSLAVYESPAGPPLQLDTEADGKLKTVTIPNPLESNAPATFSVRRKDVAAGGENWNEIDLPVRPNGSVGWVKSSDVTMTYTDMKLTVHLSQFSAELSQAGSVLATYKIATGTAENPTPVGTFFVKELVAPSNPKGAYGPLAYGLSAHSTTLLDTEAFKDGVIGIHGTNTPEKLGTAASHGCIRLRNEDVLDLQKRQVPLGMKVEILA